LFCTSFVHIISLDILVDFSGGQVVEDVLTSGLSAKLMRYLRVRVLGETSTSQKDATHLTESKHASGSACIIIKLNTHDQNTILQSKSASSLKEALQKPPGQRAGGTLCPIET
jgi:hypothetical protein